eukprot:935851-Prymnesium_polylepis.1
MFAQRHVPSQCGIGLPCGRIDKCVRTQPQVALTTHACLKSGSHQPTSITRVAVEQDHLGRRPLQPSYLHRKVRCVLGKPLCCHDREARRRCRICDGSAATTPVWVR